MNAQLITLRKKKKLTQAEVAKALSISRAYYGMIENNQRAPSLAVAKKIADYFDVKIEDVF